MQLKSLNEDGSISYQFSKRKAIMHNIRAFFIIVAVVSIGMAQTVTISGKVIDMSGLPLSGAIVTLEQGRQTATTGNDGGFSLSGGAVGINERVNQSPSKLSARIIHGVLQVNGQGNLPVEICAYNLKGQEVPGQKRTLKGGTQSIALPPSRDGVYLYKVKSSNEQVLIKSYSVGTVGAALSVQSKASNLLAKRAKVADLMNDIIAVTKDGYLNFREMITNSDTSGIEIKMIVCAGTVKDTDGNVYQTVKIGNQIWTVENLRTTKFSDGSPIPLVTNGIAWGSLTTPGYCYYNNITNTDSMKKWGALYNWYAVDTKKLAPGGWHVPTYNDWDTLANYLTVNGLDAKSLAAKTDWYPYLYDGEFFPVGLYLSENNKTGFSAIPSGSRGCSTDTGIVYIDAQPEMQIPSAFNMLGAGGYWWSSTEPSCADIVYQGSFFYPSSPFADNTPGIGGSVRLVKDN